MRLAWLAVTLALCSAAAPSRAEEPAVADPESPLGASDAADARAAAVSALPPPEPSPAVTQAREDARRDDGFARWGLFVDAGLPEGGAASAVFRPVSQIRLFGGPAWSGIGFGVQAGVTVVPWHVGVSPLASVEAGRFFGADASFMARSSSGVPEEIEPLLKDVGYEYAAAHVGLELGSKNGFALSLRAGLAYVSLTAKGRATVIDSGTGTTVTFVDPKVRGTLPSVKLGFQYWF